jgi:hypothetical protein
MRRRRAVEARRRGKINGCFSNARLLGRVMLGVSLRGFAGVMFGVRGMAVGDLGVMGAFFSRASAMMLGGFVVMLGGLFVMLGGLGVMVRNLFRISHLLNSFSLRPHIRRELSIN